MPRTFGHPPTARESHTSAVYSNGERSPKLIVYGGMSGCRLGDIYVLDCSKLSFLYKDIDMFSVRFLRPNVFDYVCMINKLNHACYKTMLMKTLLDSEDFLWYNMFQFYRS